MSTAAEIPKGSLRKFEVGETSICVAHAEDGNFYAISDTCTHEEESLSEGELFGMAVECPLHNSLFDIRTGAVSGAPATLPVRTYRVSLDDGDVCVEA